jgi:DNA-binding response OmpR family regulator
VPIGTGHNLTVLTVTVCHTLETVSQRRLLPTVTCKEVRVAHLLVVDDEPRIARLVSRVLVSHGYDVETAGTGEEALLKAAERDFDLVILDLLLPGIDGHTVLRELLARDSRARVLVLSALGDFEVRAQCLEEGAVDYVSKPFAVADLLARVDAQLADAPSEVPPAGRSTA